MYVIAKLIDFILTHNKQLHVSFIIKSWIFNMAKPKKL